MYLVKFMCCQVFFLNLAILVGVEWYLVVIYNSLVMYDVEYLFIFATCVSSMSDLFPTNRPLLTAIALCSPPSFDVSRGARF